MTIGAVETPKMSNHLGTCGWYLSAAAKNTNPVDNMINKEADQNECTSRKFIGKIALMIIPMDPNTPNACASRNIMIWTRLFSIFQVDKPTKNSIRNNAVVIMPMLYKMAPWGLRVALPRSLSQFFIGEKGSGYRL